MTTDLDTQLETFSKKRVKQQCKKSAQLYAALRKEHNKPKYYTENEFIRACDEAAPASATAIFVCLRYLVTYTQPAQWYHPLCGSYKLYTTIDKWAQETSTQKHVITESAVIEACRLLELRMRTEERNPRHFEIAFAFVWETEPEETVEAPQ